MQDSYRMRTKRPAIAIALISLLFAIYSTIVIVNLLRLEVQQAVGRSLDSVQSVVDQATGLSLDYDYLSIDAVNRFTMHGIRLVRKDAPDVSPVQVRSVSLRISYWALITGRSTEVLKEVSASDLQVDLVLPEDEFIVQKLYKILFEGPLIVLPRFQLNIEPVHVHLKQNEPLADGTIHIESFQLSTLGGFPEIVAPSISADLGGFFGLPKDLSSKIGIDGSLAADFSTFDFSVNISAGAPSVLLLPQQFVVSKRGSRIEARRRGKGLELVGWYEKGRWGLQGDMSGYRVSGDMEGKGEVWEVVKGVRGDGHIEAWGEGKVLGGYRVDVKGAVDEGVRWGKYALGGLAVGLKGEGDSAGYRGVVEGVHAGYGVRYEGEVGYASWAVKGSYTVSGAGVRVRGTVEGSGDRYGVEVAEGNVRGLVLGEGAGQVKLTGEGYEVGYRGGVGAGRVSGEGSIGKDGGFEGVVEVEKVDVASVVAATGLKLQGVEGVVSGRVYGLVRGGKVSWALNGGEYEGRVQGVGVKVGLEGVGDEAGYTLKRAQGVVGGIAVGLEGKGMYTGEVFRGQVTVGGIGYGVQVGVKEGEVGITVGDTAEGKVVFGGSRIEGQVRLKGFGVGVGGGVVWLKGGARGWYEKDAWGLELTNVGVRYEGEGVYPQLEVSGTVDAKGAKLTIDYFEYNARKLKGELTITYASIDSIIRDFDASYTLSSIDYERAEIEGTIKSKDGIIDAAITANALPIEQFIPSSLKIAGDLQLKGKASASLNGDKFSLANFSLLEVQFKMQKGEINGLPFSASGTADFKDSVLSIKDGSFAYLNHKIDAISANYDIKSGSAHFGAQVRSVIAEKLFTAYFNGDGKIAQDNPWNDLQFSGQIAKAIYNSRNIDDIGYVAAFKNGNIDLNLNQANGSNAHASITSMSEFEVSLNNFFKLTGTAKGSVKENAVEADVSLNKFDLAALQMFIPENYIKDMSGSASCSLKISGDLNDPAIDGNIALKAVSFSSNIYLLEKVGPFDADMKVSEGIIELGPAIIKVGTESISLAATASLSRWEIGDIKAFISTQETAALRFKGTIAGLTAKDIRAKTDLTATLSQSGLEIKGNIFLDNGTLEVNPAGFVVSPETAKATVPLSLNIALTLGKNVELYLPGQDFPLVSGMSSPNSALNILYDQASGAFSVTGKVELRSGYVLYLLRNFFIKQCTIEFSENQTKFNPLINAVAELRESSKDGMIIVTLSADQTPFENFKPKLSSIPPKSEIELLALLGGGLALSETSDNNPLTIREAMIASSEFLTQNSLFRSFEQRVQKALGLDVLYVRSSFIQKWLLDITGQSTKDLANYLSGTELFVGKYITDSAFAHFILRMAQNPLEETGVLQLDSELGLEFQSPFGLLEWGLSFGKEGTPLNNQKISLSWRINY